MDAGNVANKNNLKNNRMKKTKILTLLIGILVYSCNQDTQISTEKKEFITSFESVDDFSGFYITPQGYLGTSFHELTDSIVHSGTYAHKAWIEGTNPPSTPTVNNNHRAYPTIQFTKTKEGVFTTPCYITLWVWVDMDLTPNLTGGEDDWLSLATFTDDESDNWARTVLVNLSYDGFVHLGNVPTQGAQTHIFQTNTLKLPQKEWVEIKIYIDFSKEGYAKVWQNGTLVSYATINNIDNKLAQAHFGLYCPPQMESGSVYNDDIVIKEVDKE